MTYVVSVHYYDTIDTYICSSTAIPDHTLPQRNRKKEQKLKHNQPAVPIQAKVIRRITWASRSLGTVEYTDDLFEERAKAEQRRTLAVVG